MYPGPLQMLAGAFEHYTGSMTVKLVFTSSPLVRTRYLVNVAGNYGALANPTDNGTAVAYVVDVCGSTEFSFVVPYYGLTPTAAAGWNGVYSDVSTTDPVILISAMVTPAGIVANPAYPGLEVWYSGGPDMSFTYPSLRSVASTWQAQGEGEGIDGTSVDSIITLAKRCSLNFVAETSIVEPTGTYRSGVSFPADGMAPFYDGVTLPTGFGYGSNLSNCRFVSWTFAHYFATMFLGHRGGRVFRVGLNWTETGINNEVNKIVFCQQGRDIPGCTVGGNYLKYVWSSDDTTGMQVFRAGDMVEVSTEDRSIYACHMPQRYPWIYNGIGTTRVVSVATIATTAGLAVSQVSVYMGAADDFLYTGYMGNPTFVAR